MQATIETRLKELREEYASGQKVMAELQNRQADLHQTLMRISGAIQVLEELLQAGTATSGEASPPPPG